MEASIDSRMDRRFSCMSCVVKEDVVNSIYYRYVVKCLTRTRRFLSSIDVLNHDCLTVGTKLALKRCRLFHMVSSIWGNRFVLFTLRDES